jgi:hypothetical protein
MEHDFRAGCDERSLKLLRVPHVADLMRTGAAEIEQVEYARFGWRGKRKAVDFRTQLSKHQE